RPGIGSGTVLVGAGVRRPGPGRTRLARPDNAHLRRLDGCGCRRAVRYLSWGRSMKRVFLTSAAVMAIAWPALAQAPATAQAQDEAAPSPAAAEEDDAKA